MSRRNCYIDVISNHQRENAKEHGLNLVFFAEAERGSKDMKDVHYYEGEAARREQEIIELQRRLGK